MKNFWVVTFFGAPNFGAFLQGAASASMLKRMTGVAPILFNPNPRSFYGRPSLTKVALNLDCLRLKNYLKDLKKLNYKYSFADSLDDAGSYKESTCDVAFFGSDQVLNSNCYVNGEIERAFKYIPVEARIVGLAMSAMNESNLLELTKIEDDLKRMQVLSVREGWLKCPIEKISKKSVEIVPDPSFGIDASDIVQVSGVENIEWGDHQVMSKVVVGYDIEKWFPSIGSDAKSARTTYINYDWRVVHKYGVSIDGPVSIFQKFCINAEVVTNSFHGICLGLLLRKRIVVPHQANKLGGHRVVSLINDFKFEKTDSSYVYEPNPNGNFLLMAYKKSINDYLAKFSVG